MCHGNFRNADSDAWNNMLFCTLASPYETFGHLKNKYERPRKSQPVSDQSSFCKGQNSDKFQRTKNSWLALTDRSVPDPITVVIHVSPDLLREPPHAVE